MWFVIIGVAIIGMNLANVGPFANWTWEITGDLWKFCVPFIFAVIWWAYADMSGLNKRREMEKMENRKKARRQENLVSLGMGSKRRDTKR